MRRTVLYSRHRKSGASTAVLVLPSATPGERSERGQRDETVAARVPPRWGLYCLKKKNSMLYLRHRKSGASAAVLVLPRATPGERSERGQRDETVAARVPPRYAFGDRGHFYLK
ncbi:hypothetical protein NDU88_003339 [Pleurodeles waltl]|uniref:Uncharacterized protein n=1 Tax=Pleurodeles waltl TaxID=8319 RepID=A0AAV7LGS9_PLEWA|nr:hypothetical protein NDU88_003339 [Pleurodeles waltl]